MEKSGLITTSDNKDFLDFPETRIIFSDNANPPYGKDKFLHNDKMNVLMTHCILVNEPTIYDHILIDELETNADIVTVADYHPYQGILERKDGVKFLAPGAMCRRKRTKHDMERKLRGMYFTSNRKMKEFMIPYVEDVWNTKIVEPENISQDIKEEVGRMKLEIDAELSNMSLDKALEVFFSMKKTDHVVASFIQERIKTL
jgi:exonuclease SbcD